MNALNIAALLITISALFSYINYRFIKLPTTIGLMLIALAFSIILIALTKLGIVGVEIQARALLSRVDFNQTLMQGMLSFLLFAGALHVNINDLREQKWVIGGLATIGILISTLIIAVLTWYVLDKLGVAMPFVYCLLFGALISPTDPIAVLGILKTTDAPKTLATKITGESLFNDGVAVVVFIVLLDIVTGGQDLSAGHVVLLFAEEAIGGGLFGLLIGWLTYSLLKSVDNYQVEVLLTLALVMGGYSLAFIIHVSGPIAIVVAGLMIGNHGRVFAMTDKTRDHLDSFWELLDEILNAVLFVLIGLELLVISFKAEYLNAALIIIPIVLLARLISVSVPISILKFRREFSPHVIKILTWGGLRGGISVALALSLPPGGQREIILAITYIVVIFSISVQGLTIGKLIKKTTPLSG